MIELKDYISALVSSVTKARVGADLVTAQVAKEYLEDEVLRHFSVPRMRIGDMELNVPVAVDSAEVKRIFNTNVNIAETIETVFSTLCLSCSLSIEAVNKNHEIAASLREFLKDRLIWITENLKKHQDFTILNRIPYDMVRVCKEILISGMFDVKNVEDDRIASAIEKPLQRTFLLTSIDSLNVIIDTSKLREQPSQAILNLKIKIIEEGMEWSISKNEKGIIETKLLPA